MSKKVIVHIITEQSDFLSQFDFEDQNAVSIDCRTSRYPELKDSSLLVIEIDSLKSKFITLLWERYSEFKDRTFIVIPSQEGLVFSSLVKMGYRNLFAVPEEKQRLINNLNQAVKGLYRKLNSLQPNELNAYGQAAFNRIIGDSPQIKAVKENAVKVSANSDLSILITGETGTGKGLLASAIHNYSNTSSNPFIEVVCTAIPETLLESELFGHEKGAFTDAKAKKIGLFELAEGGTLFLDEIGDISLAFQAKLLRAIEKKIIRRVGGTKDIKINTRIISATNQDLAQLSEQNLFRKDLFFRLNVVNLELPPLRNRGDDVLELTEYFISHFNKFYSKNVHKFGEKVTRFLRNYFWPGNVRELSNFIERGIVLADDEYLRLENFKNLSDRENMNEALKESPWKDKRTISLDFDSQTTILSRVEEVYAQELFRQNGKQKSKTAKMLGISRPKLEKLLKNFKD